MTRRKSLPLGHEYNRSPFAALAERARRSEFLRDRWAVAKAEPAPKAAAPDPVKAWKAAGMDRVKPPRAKRASTKAPTWKELRAHCYAAQHPN